jgi:hypothetical protein
MFTVNMPNRTTYVPTFFDDGEETLATMINEGSGFKTQDDTQQNTQSVPISIDIVQGQARSPGHSQATGNKELERKCKLRMWCFVSEAWMEIGHDPICGAEKKGRDILEEDFNFFMSIITWVTTHLSLIAMKTHSQKGGRSS